MLAMCDTGFGTPICLPLSGGGHRRDKDSAVGAPSLESCERARVCGIVWICHHHSIIIYKINGSENLKDKKDKLGVSHWKYLCDFIGIPSDDFYQWSNVTLLQSSLTVTELEAGEKEDEQIVAEIMGRRFFPDLVVYKTWEGFHFAGHEIRITEATDCYGAVVWPSALVLCYFLETNSKQCNLVDKNVIEIGAGTGLVSIVASLLGAFVTATDLPELLGNLQHNVLQNTKQKCKHQPCVKELSWGIDLEKNFPRSSCHFDYIMAADVVYHHPFLEELLLTFDHLCKNDTVILWAMKFRLENENRFVDRFQTLFDLEMISNFPSLNIALYKAMRKGRMKARPSKPKV